MKKSISINISGMLFNIEEDAYERLKLYLDEIKLYFASYDADGEIVTDIESRIAEIFYTKVSPSKQVITLGDVEALIAQMGNIQDFAAVEATFEEPQARTSTHTSSSTYSNTAAGSGPAAEPAASNRGRRLYRDESRKVIGGVAAGIAHYLRIDPMWIRLLLVGFMAFDVFLTLALSSSALVVAYIILWIALPVSNELVEDKKYKKMYRNPDDKVLAGVAGGLAAYFGVDVVLIRILFVLLFVFGGSGFLIYVILWISMPLAKTLTDRMQMQGEPVTLSNIEHQIKKNLNLKEDEEESFGVRMLLFPFRLVATLFSIGAQGVKSFLSFLGEAIRVVSGFALSLGGFVALLAIVVIATVVMGSFPDTYAHISEISVPLNLLRNTLPSPLLLASFGLVAIPVFFVLMIGIGLLARRWVLGTGPSWALAGLWLIALISTAAMAPEVAMNYRTEGYYESKATFAADSSQTLVLRMENGHWKDFNNIDLTIKGTPEGSVLLEQKIWARGATDEEAREHAQLASYPVVQKGNTLLFADQLQLPDNKPFYAQHAKATLYIPYGQAFSMEWGMRKILYNTLTPWGYRTEDLGDNLFAFNQQGELECLTCPAERTQKARTQKEYSITQQGRILNYRDFSELQVGSHYQLTLVNGPDYKVEVSGKDKDLDQMEVEQKNGILSFFTEGWTGKLWNSSGHEQGKVKIFVSVPNLAGLYLSGASTAEVKLQQDQPLKVALSGASEMQGTLEVDQLEVDMSGSSELTLEGRCQTLKAELSGASQLMTDAFRALSATVDLGGASEARLWVTDRLAADVSGGSELAYKGRPATDFNKGRGAEINQLGD
ncbi:PspC domain-containing protein [Cesiribacter andamanensis]|uniref:DNA-binding transcriptional activator PspC n=1 Tax=Cesiribacter andamanensis AMV16 TaxID=1279009 RepID=M7NQX6_9BACT|nr:PspC domain-containing protein [Cesiribacter andamanensis]EMR04120.1 DNA-binding transcriptional activator PspC [Cesiribacter andamanensis AMV16]